MKTTFLKTALAIAVLVAGFTASAQPQNGPNQNKGPKKDKMEMIIAKLQLTPEQADQMKANHMDMKKAAQPIQNQIGEKEARLRTLSTIAQPNAKDVEKVANEIADLRGKLFVMKTMTRLETRALLNEDQKIIFDTMKLREGQKDGHRGGQKSNNKG
ncbi:MAG: periplasmic heavy metal sensor [Reichenbachiella sp.]